MTRGRLAAGLSSLAVSAGLAGLAFSQAPASPAPPAGPPPTVVFLSDFGVVDDSVAICKGVMWGVLPGLRIVDLTHDVPVFDVAAASRLVSGTAGYYPSGTVFVAVVDPGVGTERKAVAIRSRAGRTYVGPDNGLFTAVVEREGLDRAHEITNPKYIRPASETFHGRDLFSPVAAHLAAGVAIEELGPKLERLVRLEVRPARIEAGAIVGSVDFVERPYGNVITDVPAELLKEAGLAQGDLLAIELGGDVHRLPYLKTFGDVPVGDELALPSSRGRLSFSVNMGSFAGRHGVVAGQKLRVSKNP